MKTLVVIAVTIFTSLFAAELQAQINPEAQKAVQNLFGVTKAEDLYNQKMQEYLNAELKKKPQFAQYRPQIESALNKGMSWNKVKTELAKIYAREMTADEINKTADFYKTTAGYKFFQKIVDGTLSWSKVQQDQTILTKNFKPDEIQQIATFATSPTGLKMMQKGPIIAQNSEAYLKKQADKCIKSAAGQIFMEAMKKNGGNVHF